MEVDNEERIMQRMKERAEFTRSLANTLRKLGKLGEESEFMTAYKFHIINQSQAIDQFLKEWSKK